MGGGGGDRCWDKGMLRGYVSGYVSRHHELLWMQFSGVSGVCFGACFAGCNPRALLKPEPLKNERSHIGIYENKGLGLGFRV